MSGRTVYVTKYALTMGIVACEEAPDLHHDLEGKYRRVQWAGGMNGRLLVSVKEAHLSLDAAQARVREMIEAKRKSLHKQTAALNKLERDGVKVVTR